MKAAAVLENQAEICVGQFMAEPKHQENLKEMGALESWKRGEYIEKGDGIKCPAKRKSPIIP